MRCKRDFLIVAALVTTWFALAQSPRLDRVDQHATGWKAGWPVRYETWGYTPDGELYAHHFWPDALLVNLAAWFALIVVMWLVIWPHGRTA